MNIPIIYEDEQIVVIDKPSGVICNRADTVKVETLQDWMIATARVDPLQQGINPSNEDQAYFVERSGLVHRLDKETSGVMMLAKTVESFVELLRQFREREVVKTYRALTHGIWGAREGIIELPIGRRSDNRQRMGVREDGRESVTEYKVLKEYKGFSFPRILRVDDRGYSGFSHVEFMPKTGRMHQIRVHAKHMGHPLVGDEQYAGRKRSREDRKWAPRVMLQAATLELTHPTKKTRMKWESEGNIVDLVKEYLS